MGKAIALLQSEAIDEAEDVFTHTINYLKANLETDDPTGTAVLAGAYANRGTPIRSNGSPRRSAVRTTSKLLKIDPEAVKGPSIIDKIFYVTPRLGNCA